MPLRTAAVLTVLALASCFGRVSAWAAPAGDPHACCRGEASAPAGPMVAECCATPAAIAAIRVPAPALVLVGVVSAEPVTAAFSPLAVESESPPGPQTLRAAVPARAPPLAA